MTVAAAEDRPGNDETAVRTQAWWLPVRRDVSPTVPPLKVASLSLARASVRQAFTGHCCVPGTVMRAGTVTVPDLSCRFHQ